MGQKCCTHGGAADIPRYAAADAQAAEKGAGRDPASPSAPSASSTASPVLKPVPAPVDSAKLRPAASRVSTAGAPQKSPEELLRALERSATLLERHHGAVLRHPGADAEVLARLRGLTRKLTLQAQSQRCRQSRSWDGVGDDEEWRELLLGSRRCFASLRDVVRQVMLECRILRRWRRQLQPAPGGGLAPAAALAALDVDGWQAVDVFRLERETRQPLAQVFTSVWRRRGLGVLSKASSEQAADFLRAVEGSYLENPYHNRMHAAEVTLTAYGLWSQLAAQDAMSGYFSMVDLLVLMVAAAVHDMAHPGTGNDFLVKTQHELALRYSDRSVLEHFHAATAFALLQEMRVPLLEHGMPSPPADTLKGRVVDMILATDMAQHRRVTEDLCAEVAEHTPQDVSKLALERHLLHFADIGHPLRPRPIHREWSERVREEFLAQGDAEKLLGLSPAPLCDRDKAPSLPRSQVGFLSFVVGPAWKPLAQVLGAGAAALEARFADNRAMWQVMVDEEEAAREGGSPASGASATPCRRQGMRKLTTSKF